MKRLIFIAQLFLLTALAMRGAEPLFSNEDLTATVIEPGVTVLETSDKTTLYLVEGDSAAVLIDTGTSIKNLDKIVEHLTSLPLKVLLTHGHPDHAGNIAPFSEIYMHPADTVLDTPALREYKGRILPLAEGDTFQLGNRRIDVAHIPGHTPGSVAFIDYANSMAFTGDAFGSGQLWMQLLPQVPMCTLIESCGRMIDLMDNKGVSKLYVGHYPYLKRPLDIDYLTDVNITARMIDAGDTSAAAPFGTDARILRHGTAEIVYRPEVAGLKTLKPKTLLLKLDDVHYGEGIHSTCKDTPTHGTTPAGKNSNK